MGFEFHRHRERFQGVFGLNTNFPPVGLKQVLKCLPGEHAVIGDQNATRHLLQTPFPQPEELAIRPSMQLAGLMVVSYQTNKKPIFGQYPRFTQSPSFDMGVRGSSSTGSGDFDSG